MVLIKENKILLSKRQNTGFEDGNYSMVAGHLDGNETFRQAMVREAKEEASIEIQTSDLEVIHVLHRTQPNHTAYEENGVKYKERVDLFLQAEKWDGEIKNNEKDKCLEISWFDIDNLPKNTVDYIKYVIKEIRQGRVYSEFGWKQAGNLK